MNKAHPLSIDITMNIRRAADDISNFICSEKICIVISCESAIHMKWQALFSLKKKRKKKKKKQAIVCYSSALLMFNNKHRQKKVPYMSNAYKRGSSPAFAKVLSELRRRWPLTEKNTGVYMEEQIRPQSYGLDAQLNLRDLYSVLFLLS